MTKNSLLVGSLLISLLLDDWRKKHILFGDGQPSSPAWVGQEGGHRSLFIVHILEISPFSECLNWLEQNILVDP